MTDLGFEIEIIQQYWIGGVVKDDEDLCSHGDLYIEIGGEVLSDGSSGSPWTLTAAGLYLLRTCFEDYRPGDYGSQLVPCCGFSMIPHPDSADAVLIFGCSTGIDWQVSHFADNVELSTANGAKAILALKQYTSIVLRFISKVEDFYGPPESKILPTDPEEQKGFKMFWTEWNKLKAGIADKR